MISYIILSNREILKFFNPAMDYLISAELFFRVENNYFEYLCNSSEEINIYI